MKNNYLLAWLFELVLTLTNVERIHSSNRAEVHSQKKYAFTLAMEAVNKPLNKFQSKHDIQPSAE